MTEETGEEHRTFSSGSEALSAVVCSTINTEDIEFSLNFQQAAFAQTHPFFFTLLHSALTMTSSESTN